MGVIIITISWNFMTTSRYPYIAILDENGSNNIISEMKVNDLFNGTVEIGNPDIRSYLLDRKSVV